MMKTLANSRQRLSLCLWLIMLFSFGYKVATAVPSDARKLSGPENSGHVDTSWWLEEYTFEQFEIDFDKTYSTDQERNHRREIFLDNWQRIRTHNQQQLLRLQQQQQQQQQPRSHGSHFLGVNPYADRQPHELYRGYAKSLSSQSRVTTTSFKMTTSASALTEGLAATTPKRSLRSSAVFARQEEDDQDDQEAALGPDMLQQILLNRLRPVSALPAHVDWRARGVTTPVKSQGMCGSCWAFAATAVLESHLAIQSSILMELSEQELVSCVDNPLECGGTGGCGGATAELAYDHVRRHGVVQEWDFGYQSYHGEDNINCTLHPFTSSSPLDDHDRASNILSLTDEYYRGAVASIAAYASLPSNNYTVMMNAVAMLGPIAVSVACLPWHLYRSGVFYAPFDQKDSRTTDVNHLVVLEGYGTDPITNQDYWLVRNSWGPLWGEQGYIRLLRREHNDDEETDPYCGMDVTPDDGDACSKDDQGHRITPPPAKICGNSGILYDSVVPLGGFLLPRQHESTATSEPAAVQR